MKVAVSGYFLIYHAGHEEYLRRAKARADYLVVILNNDKQQILKYGKVIVSMKQRYDVLKSVKYVDEIFISIDEDETVNQSLKFLNPDIFAKGGDRDITNIPEKKVCNEMGIVIADGMGSKIQSSSDLLKL